jgi:hypothetical protein
MGKFTEFLEKVQWARLKYGVYVGAVFSVIVIGLIIYGNFFAKSVTLTSFVWRNQPVLHICDSAPEWAREGSEDLTRALDWWKERGWSFVSITTGPCPDVCKGVEEDGETLREVTCNKGRVTLDVMDKWWNDNHVGLCTRVVNKESFGAEEWSTITVPSQPFGPDSDPRDFPAHPRAQVLAHEIGHCLVGLGHNVGPPLIPGLLTLNPKTGHIMNPVIQDGGWNDESIEKGKF